MRHLVYAALLLYATVASLVSTEIMALRVGYARESAYTVGLVTACAVLTIGICIRVRAELKRRQRGGKP